MSARSELSRSVSGRISGVVSPAEQDGADAAPCSLLLADEARQAVREHELDRRELLIGKRISAGSFALVYAGRYRNELVAIKVLRSDRVSPKDFRTYIKEVQLIHSFNHPHVLRFIGVCCEPPHVCIVTEFLERGSLFHLLHPRPHGAGEAPPERLSLHRVLMYAEGVAKGMQYLHQCQVIHRDLKSGNILLDGRDNIKVADFGVARRLSSRSESMTAETGTYRWMAPEVIRHARYDHRVDVYSFGIVCWEMLSGQLPYGALSPIQAAAAVVVDNLRPPLDQGAMPADTPVALLALMRACWNVDAEVRPQFDAIAAQVGALREAEAARRSAAGDGSGRHAPLQPEAGLAGGEWPLPPPAEGGGPPGGSVAAVSPHAVSAPIDVAAPPGGPPMRHLRDLQRSDSELAELEAPWPGPEDAAGVLPAGGAAAAAPAPAPAPAAAPPERRRSFLHMMPCCAASEMSRSL